MVFAEAAVSKAREVGEKETLRVEMADKERERLVADLRELQHDGASLVSTTPDQTTDSLRVV